VIDAAKAVQAKDDLEALKNAVSDADATATKEMSPDYYAKFAEIHGPGEIGIPAEVARANENELDWIPSLSQRLNNAEPWQGDIWVSRSEFLARTDKGLVNEIGDSLKLRDGGVSVDSTKIDVPPKQVIAEMLPAVRGGAGLEPMAMAGDRKITLSPHPDFDLKATNHGMDIIDERGKIIGGLYTSLQEGGKAIYVENIQAGSNEKAYYDPNFLGYSVIKDLKRQLKAIFPGVETITGHRVTGMRFGKLGEGVDLARPFKPTDMPRVKLDEAADPQPFRDMLSAMWEPVGQGVEALFHTEGKGVARDSPIGQLVMNEIARIAPGAKIDVAHGVTINGRPVYGAYIPSLREAIVSLEEGRPADYAGPIGAAHHEGGHFLRASGLFTEKEFSQLITDSINEKWREQFDIDKRYHYANENARDEEAIFNAYGAWKDGKLKVPEVTQTVFTRIKDFLDNLRKAVLDHLGIERDYTWQEIFEKIDSGEIGARAGEAGLQAGVRAAEPPASEFPIEGGKALGVTKRFLTKEEKLIQQRNLEDYEREVRLGLAKAGRQARADYKEKLAQAKESARNQMLSHPGLAVDKFVTENGIKFDPQYLTKEQRERIPKDAQAKGGIKPDDIAGVFGYKSGDALIERYAMLTEDRARTKMSQKGYFNHKMNEEVSRRMEGETDKPSAEQLEDVRDHALSETQMQLTHEQVMRRAIELGQEPKFTLDDMKDIAKKILDDTPLEEIKSSRYLQKGGETMMKILEAEQRGKNQEVYKLLQAHQLSQLLARAARRYEKMRGRFEGWADFFSKDPTPASGIGNKIDVEYFNWLQDTLDRLGYKVGRTREQLNDAINLEKHSTLESFARAKMEKELRDLNIPDFVMERRLHQLGGMEKLKHSEFEDLYRMFETMNHEGRNERALVLGGRQMELDEQLGDLIKQTQSVASLPPKTVQKARPYVGRKTAKGIWWAHITPEAMWDRLDRGDKNGIFHRLLSYPAAAMINHEVQLMDKYKAKFKEVGDFKDMDKDVENDVFRDQQTGELIPMKRRNVLGVLAYWGNASNIAAISAGYKVDPYKILQFLQKNTTREDWVQMQKIGDIFKELFNESEAMSRKVTGVGINRVELKRFTDPFGQTHEGWYSPIAYDKERFIGETGPDMDDLARPGYFKSNTDQRYAKERQKPVPGRMTDLTLDAIPQRMAEMIHDIAIRPTAIEMRKILYNDKLSNAINAAFGGRHQLEEMRSWLNDVTNKMNVDVAGQRALNSVVGYLSRNMVSTMVGFNISTFAKHVPTALIQSMGRTGPLNFLKASYDLFKTDSNTMQRKLWTAYNESTEMQGRMHNYTDLLRGQGESFKFEQGTKEWVRELVSKLGSAPVSFGDFASVAPTYWAVRQEAIREGRSLEEAIDLGNAAIRETHGTSRLTGRPGIMRGNELSRTYTTLYGFFSHILQGQYKLAWNARDLINGQKPMNITTDWAWTGSMLPRFMLYFIVPAVLDEIITPYTNEEKDSFAMKGAKIMANGLSGSLPFVRDLVRGLVSGDVEDGTIGTAMKLPQNLMRDLTGPMNADHASMVVKDAAALNGLLTGWTTAPMGRAGQYIMRYSSGLERPKGPWDVGVGLRYGKTDKHYHTFAEWWDHTVEGKR
jgi:hypothetical protein